jgi:dTDP-4-dehydrorhamnose reductase
VTPMRVLVVGGTGMLGHKLVQELARHDRLEVHVATRRMPPPAFAPPTAHYLTGVDLGEGSRAIAPVLATLAPDVVVNAVGAIKQRDLYAAPDETFFLNGSLPHLLGLLNPNPNGRVVHFSTDCVYRGDRGGYRESDAPDAPDLYGRSKACGELDYGGHLTLRTSIVGWEVGGFLGLLSWFLGQPRGSQLRGFRRAVFSGLPTVTLAATVAELILDRPELRGLYHVASEPIDKLDLLRRVNARLELGHELVPDDSLVIDRSLDDARFRQATSTVRPGWDALVEALAQDFAAYPYRDLYPSLAAAVHQPPSNR